MTNPPPPHPIRKKTGYVTGWYYKLYKYQNGLHIIIDIDKQ